MLPIGKVVDVVPDQYGLTQTAYVKPSANLYDINHVMVVKRKMKQPDVSNIVDNQEEEDL